MLKMISRYPYVAAWLALIGLLASGCTPPEVKPQAHRTVTPAQPVKPPEPVTPPAPEPVKKPDVAILLSNNSSVYREVADDLMKRLQGRASVFVLTDVKVTNQGILKQLADQRYGQVVTLGLPAARAGRNLQDKQTVFSQIVNYPQYNLVDSASKGVDALPAVEPLFRDWHRLSPEVKKVLVITGPNLGYYLVPAMRAAKKYGIELVHKQVKYDREYLYESKQAQDVQGQWIIPDNRVISRQLLKDLLAYNSHAGRQTLVFNNSLLQYGGLMMVEPDPADIGRLVAARLEQSIGHTGVPGPDVLAVIHNRIELNPLVAKQLGIQIPADFDAALWHPEKQNQTGSHPGEH